MVTWEEGLGSNIIFKVDLLQFPWPEMMNDGVIFMLLGKIHKESAVAKQP